MCECKGRDMSLLGLCTGEAMCEYKGRDMSLLGLCARGGTCPFKASDDYFSRIIVYLRVC